MPSIESTLERSKSAQYRALNVQLTALFAGEHDGLANTANMAAVLYYGMPDVNWVGFYILRKDELVLGPFQGKVACVRIALGSGVCGSAALRQEAVIVPDVHAFPGHIACDADSRSEIVVPLIRGGRLLGVLDVDSTSPARFDDEDRSGLAICVATLLQSSDLQGLIE